MAGPPVLCLITNLTSIGSAERLVARVAEAARAGVHLVQVREPELEGGALAALVRALVLAVAGTGARLLVNDRLDVALATGAAGVHLTERSFSATDVRTAVPRGFLVGRSVHDPDAVPGLDPRAHDYLLLAPVFATASKPTAPPLGTSELARAVRATAVPVLALGGVTTLNAGEVAATGAAGVAGIGLWLGPSPVAETARALSTAFRGADRYTARWT